MPTTIVALDGWDSVVGWGESPWDSGRIALAELQGGVGSVGVYAPAVFVTGVSASGAVGEVLVPQSPSVSVTGVSATSSVGSVTLRLGATVFVAGVSATGYVGSVLLWDQIVPAQSPDWIEIAA